MARADLDVAVEWAAAEGWNPGLQDASCFWAADPAGFYVGKVGADPATCISAVRYGDAFAFVGFYICRPEHRGRGYGLKTWEHAFAELRAPTVGLDGVVDQQANYARSGFELAHRNIRFSAEDIDPSPADPHVRTLGPEHLKIVSAYDRRRFGCERLAFLEAWLKADGHRVVGTVTDGSLTGYGVARPCREGMKIGPLFADDRVTAETLFDALAAGVSGRPVFLDVPEPNTDAVGFARSRGFEPVFETARMYRGADWSLPLDTIFGITSFELG